MKTRDFELAADNACKLFEWLEKRMTIPEGVEMMVVSLAITIRALAKDHPDFDLDEATDMVCDMIKDTVDVLGKIPADERA